MSSERKPARRQALQAAAPKPLIGSLLRLPREYIVRRMFTELDEAGFDLSETEMAAFMYPGPEGRRPVDLARQCNMSRQAMNYVLAGLERRAYIVRQNEGAGRAGRGVQLTERGHQVFAQMRKTVAAVETEWRAHLGAERFSELRDTLAELSRWVDTRERTTVVERDG